MKDKSLIVSVLVFGIAMVCLLYGFQGLDHTSSNEDLKRVEDSVKNAIIECYSIEGSYPQDLEYLQKEYGVYINNDRYRVHYEYVGSNVMPEYVVYRKGS